MLRILFIVLLITTTSTISGASDNANERPSGSSCQNKRFQLPSGISLYCSASWMFTAECTGTGNDLVYDWKILKGTTIPKSWHIDPWEDQSIVIRAAELTEFSGPSVDWMMMGNGIVPDAMLFLGMGMRHGLHDFAAGSGMPVPAKGQSGPTEYFDLHSSCPKKWYWPWGAKISMMYTLYYTVTANDGATK